MSNNDKQDLNSILGEETKRPMTRQEFKKQEKAAKKKAKKGKLAEKKDMYDMIIANIMAGNSIIEPTVKLGGANVHIGFSDVASETHISKYFMVTKFPDFMPEAFMDIIRADCCYSGVKINFYFESSPHKINWESPEMVNKMTIWKRYTKETASEVNIFDYRNQRSAVMARKRIMFSTKYLNEAELEHKRTTMKTVFIIKVTAERDDESIINMMDSIRALKNKCTSLDIRIKELRINMIEWVRAVSPLCLRVGKETETKLSRKIMTDDTLAIFNGYKQGRVGKTGVSLGIDIKTGGPVMRKFKEDGEAADNWLITGETGSGKSYFVKTLASFLLADQFVVSIMDYEGDEYTNFGNYIKDGNPDDVKVVSMGNSSTVYFDPCEIPELTGDYDMDITLKKSAIDFIQAIYRLIIGGLDGAMTKYEEMVLSMAIQRMYDSNGVTEDMKTWHRSRGLRLSDVYYEVKEMFVNKEFLDSDMGVEKYRAVSDILDAAGVFFEQAASKAATFAHPMSANELYKARLIIFSFGMRGAADSTTDPIILALKQLSVSFVSIQISNYCKYIRHCFNVKIWEEFQRWGEAKGSAETISNAITGGRKRGDVNFILTNNLAAMLDENNTLAVKLRDNIQNYAIGSIKDKDTRAKFCEKFSQQDCLADLNKIAKANLKTKTGVEKASSTNSKYKHSFCLILEDGKRAISKVVLPSSIADSKLFKSSVIKE